MSFQRFPCSLIVKACLSCVPAPLKAGYNKSCWQWHPVAITLSELCEHESVGKTGPPHHPQPHPRLSPGRFWEGSLGLGAVGRGFPQGVTRLTRPTCPIYLLPNSLANVCGAEIPACTPQLGRPDTRYALSPEDHEGAKESGSVILGPAMGFANPAASDGRERGGGCTHLPVARHGDARVADLRPVSPGHFRAAAVPTGPTHDVWGLPAAPLHAILELLGALPLLQYHLRGARGRGQAVQRHPQPRLPLPPGLLCARRLLPGARAVSTWRRSDRPWHP